MRDCIDGYFQVMKCMWDSYKRKKNNVNIRENKPNDKTEGQIQ